MARTWLIVAAFSFLFMADGSAEDATEKPNIILVMTDDQGYGDLACLGNSILRTPHLDSLHAESVRLTNYHVSPTCSPTRASLMTGRYAHATGVWHTIQGRSIMRTEEITLAEVFREAGYRTGIFGKWHLGDNYPFRPQDQGFGEVLIHGGGGVGQTPDYFGNDYYAEDTYFHNGKAKKQQGYCTDIWFDAAMRFMQQSKEADQPFFCYLPTNAAHGPFNAKPEDAAPYKADPRCPNPGFYGMIANIDENVGRLNAFLESSGLEENTIFIFTTDNGSAVGMNKGRGYNAGMRGNKGSAYEGGHRVPFFIRWPAGGIDRARDISTAAAHIDVMPTLLDLCDVGASESSGIHGQSFANLLQGPLLQGQSNQESRKYVIDSQRVEQLKKWKNYCVVSGHWRLVGNNQKAELFNMQNDPGQQENIASAHPEAVQQLKHQYEAYWKLATEHADQPVRIPLATPTGETVRLTGHDWHQPDAGVPWHQSTVEKGIVTNGNWTVTVPKAGRYRFELRRWPREYDSAPIDIQFAQARIQVGGTEKSTELSLDQQAATFTADLAAGPTNLKTWLIDQQGTQRGAYYVYVDAL